MKIANTSEVMGTGPGTSPKSRFGSVGHVPKTGKRDTSLRACLQGVG